MGSLAREAQLSPHTSLSPVCHESLPLHGSFFQLPMSFRWVACCRLEGPGLGELRPFVFMSVVGSGWCYKRAMCSAMSFRVS